MAHMTPHSLLPPGTFVANDLVFYKLAWFQALRANEVAAVDEQIIAFSVPYEAIAFLKVPSLDGPLALH